MVSLETRSGDVLRSASAYNSKTAQTESSMQLGSDRLVARVSMQAGNTGTFKRNCSTLAISTPLGTM